MKRDIPTEDFRAKTYDVFISYRHLDAEIRDVLVEALEAAGFSVWWDAKLVSGALRPQLAEHIRTAKLVVSIWSAKVEAAPSEVQDEMSFARGLDKLVALKTDNATIPQLFASRRSCPSMAGRMQASARDSSKPLSRRCATASARPPSA
jgi:hypothetical protein